MSRAVRCRHNERPRFLRDKAGELDMSARKSVRLAHNTDGSSNDEKEDDDRLQRNAPTTHHLHCSSFMRVGMAPAQSRGDNVPE